MKILVINPGATSTKLAVYDGEKESWSHSIIHPQADLAVFDHIRDQKEYRLKLILQALSDAGYKAGDFDAVCGRGGLFRHIPSGTYRIGPQALEDVTHPIYGEHASNLGCLLAKEIGDSVGIPSYFVDPVSVDELQDVARVSGFEGMQRQSFFHALNQKSVARKTAKAIGKPYEELNLIVCHLGGGVSVAAHCRGRVIDNYNVKDEGAMGLDRGGSLPVNSVIDLCFKMGDRAAVKQLLGEKAGVWSYLHTKDFIEVEKRAFSGTDEKAALIFRAFAYQIAKDVGAMAAVLRFDVDAIALTGGLAHSDRLMNEIRSYVGRLAPVYLFPGEEEMQALAAGALRALNGGEAPLY